MKTKMSLLISLILSLFIFATVYGKDSTKNEKTIIANIKSKSGKVYSFVDDRNLAIAEKYYRSKPTFGFYDPNDIGWTTSPLFPIIVNMGEFIKKIYLVDVELIKFGEVKKGSFKLHITTKDGKVWKLLINESFDPMDDDDGVSGIEKELGEITIPFTKIETIEIMSPQKIWSGNGTKATVIK